MDALVAVLLAWIVAKTGLTAPEPPRIVRLPTEQIVQMCGGSAKPQAIYKFEDRTIYLREDWNPDTLLNKAVLVHELVHHVLKMNNVQAKCDRAHEADCYHWELTWLREQGVDDPYAFLQTSELAIVLRSMCLD